MMAQDYYHNWENWTLHRNNYAHMDNLFLWNDEIIYQLHKNAHYYFVNFFGDSWLIFIIKAARLLEQFHVSLPDPSFSPSHRIISLCKAIIYQNCGHHSHKSSMHESCIHQYNLQHATLHVSWKNKYWVLITNFYGTIGRAEATKCYAIFL